MLVSVTFFFGSLAKPAGAADPVAIIPPPRAVASFASRRRSVPPGSFRLDRVPVFVRAFGSQGSARERVAPELPLARRFSSGPDAVVDRFARPTRMIGAAGPAATSSFLSQIYLDGAASTPSVEIAEPAATQAIPAGRTRGLRDAASDKTPPVAADAVVRPGSIAAEPPTVTNPFLKSKVIAPQTPDIEIGSSGRTTLGVFSDVGKPATKIDPRDGAGRATRDLGAGVTLQYRFGN